jgi:hypothetical protein
MRPFSRRKGKKEASLLIIDTSVINAGIKKRHIKRYDKMKRGFAPV